MRKTKEEIARCKACKARMRALELDPKEECPDCTYID